jgi:hypothetical protein
MLKAHTLHHGAGTAPDTDGAIGTLRHNAALPFCPDAREKAEVA